MRHLTKSTPSGGRQALSAAEGSGTTAADGAGPTDNVLGSGWGLEHLWHDGCISWASVLEKAAGHTSHSPTNSFFNTFRRKSTEGVDGTIQRVRARALLLGVCP